EDEVLLESRDGGDANALEERIIGLVADADPRGLGEPLKSRIGLAQEAMRRGDPGTPEIDEDISEVPADIAVASDSMAHRLDRSRASRSSPSRSISSQSSRVMGSEGPLSIASRSLASRACLACRFWTSRMTERRYSLVV